MDGHSVISPDVLARYAVDAAAEVPGVHPTKRGAARVSGGEVEVRLVVDFGATIPSVAAEVQRRVVDYLQRMADVTPTTVDVLVEDVSR
ncbi:MAG TPA: Asp23/Gls24 family envelope stress response protein [Gaiellaceae bacterium]|nr:Asp23/Gls24 family envelope stress response protein [Gaiellaceae bacterium]